MSGNENAKYQQADPRSRKIALWILLASVLFGTLLIGLITTLESGIISWLEENLALLISHPEIVFLSTLLLVSPILFASAYLFRYGSQVVRQKKYPATGYSLMRKTRILEGSNAVWRGRLVQLCSAAIFCCALPIPLFITFLFVLLQSTA